MIMEDNLINKNIKCLIVNNVKDYGYSNNNLSFTFSEEFLNKIHDFKNLQDFIIHFYVFDSIADEVCIGVNRYEKCRIISFNDKNMHIVIKALNKKYFNMSELKLLRKDKIGNLLSPI